MESKVDPGQGKEPFSFQKRNGCPHRSRVIRLKGKMKKGHQTPQESNLFKSRLALARGMYE